MPFSKFQDVALNHPASGYFSGAGSVGRTGDFITSPEVGPLFGAIIASALDRWWDELGQPRPFTVVEAGAGIGTLAATIGAANPECLQALNYITVEKSEAIRSKQGDRLNVKNVTNVMRGKDGSLSSLAVTALEDLPKQRFVGVVLANELLDNLPVDLVVMENGMWHQVGVQKGDFGELKEVSIPLKEGSGLLNAARHFGEGATEGSRLALQGSSQDWLRRALGLVERGRVVVLDYATTSRSMVDAPMEDWLRTYRNQRPGTSPLDQPGTQDITCDVAIDQLEHVAPITHNTSQADFLEAHGLNNFLSDAREVWHGRAELGDLAAVRARARVQEGRILTSEPGLGAHRVLEWVVGSDKRPEPDPPIKP